MDLGKFCESNLTFVCNCDFLVWSNFGSFANVYLPGYVQNTFDENKITLGAT